MRRSRCVALGLALVVVCSARGAGALQDLGHKTLGTLGLDAGTQEETGLYVATEVLGYRADRIYDRHGMLVAPDVELHAFATEFGIAGFYELPRLHTWVGAAFAVPVARVSVTTDNPYASLDDFGLGDLYVKPIQLGWRTPHLDVVTGYAFYVPTGHIAPGGRESVGRGHWTHELSAGGTLFFDRARRVQLSALASYELNLRKEDVDLTRGSTLQIQGGVGTRVLRVIDLGLVGYALWQVTDDRGSALPPLLAGARDVDYGLGGELDAAVPALRTKVTLRYTHDVVVRSRPLGQSIVIGLTITPWQKERR
jgi:hypothetical protein